MVCMVYLHGAICDSVCGTKCSLGIQGGRITKKKGGAKKGSLAIAGGEDGEDATKF